MDLSVSSSLSKTFSLSSLSHPFSRQLSLKTNALQPSPFPRNSGILLWESSFSRQKNRVGAAPRVSNRAENDDFVLEDVPHLTNFLPDSPSYPNPLQKSQAYSVVKNTFVSPEDVVAQNIVIRKDSHRGVHFRRAGPREKVYFKPEEVRACIVTCGGLCPGINTVIREIVCGLNYMYGVEDILGIEVSFCENYIILILISLLLSIEGIMLTSFSN